MTLVIDWLLKIERFQIYFSYYDSQIQYFSIIKKCSLKLFEKLSRVVC